MRRLKHSGSTRRRARANQLADQVRHAPRHDQQAANAAIAAGEKPPPAVAPKRRAEADDAKRVAQAAEHHARVKVRALFDQLEDHQEAWIAVARKRKEDAEAEPVPKAPLHEMPRTLLAVLKRWQEAELALKAACTFVNNANVAAATLAPPDFERQFERALQRQRERFRENADIPFDPVELLAALTRIVEAEGPAS